MKEEKVRYAGMDLIMFGTVAAEGTIAIAKEGREILLRALPEDYLDEIDEWTQEAKPDCNWEELGAKRVWPIGEGGLFAALWQMALDAGCGFRMDLKQLPMRQETIEVCEVFDLNPYQLASAGSYLVAAENGNDVMWLCRKKGIQATLIGKLSKDQDKAIYNEENIRFLDRPKPDELLRFREMMKGEE